MAKKNHPLCLIHSFLYKSWTDLMVILRFCVQQRPTPTFACCIKASAMQILTSSKCTWIQIAENACLWMAAYKWLLLVWIHDVLLGKVNEKCNMPENMRSQESIALCTIKWSQSIGTKLQLHKNHWTFTRVMLMNNLRMKKCTRYLLCSEPRFLGLNLFLSMSSLSENCYRQDNSSKHLGGAGAEIKELVPFRIYHCQRPLNRGGFAWPLYFPRQRIIMCIWCAFVPHWLLSRSSDVLSYTGRWPHPLVRDEVD